jgi:hypothetical protein
MMTVALALRFSALVFDRAPLVKVVARGIG